MSFLGDELVEGGVLGAMTNGKCYREVRHFQRPYYMLRFYFITRCFSAYMQTIIADLCQRPYPDVIIMSSCLWDITRFAAANFVTLGPNADNNNNIITIIYGIGKERLTLI